MKSIKEIVVFVVAGVLLALALIGIAIALDVKLTDEPDTVPIESPIDVPIPSVGPN